MRTTLLAVFRRSPRLSSIALVGSAALAACNTDQPAGPKAPAIPAAAQPALLPQNSGKLVIQFVDGANAIIPITGGGLVVEGPGQTTWTIMDAGPNDQQYDADPAGGVIEIRNMSPGQYKFCERLPPQGYGIVNPSCQTVGISVGKTSQLVFHHLPVAHIKWSVKDFAGNYISGATFTLDSNNVVVTKVGDGSVYDSDPAPGKFDVKIPFESYWKLCVTTPPAGYVFPANQVVCVANNLKQGTVLDFGNFQVNPVYSGFWGVTNGFLDPVQGYYLIGPSTFKVTSSDQAYSYSVVDNLANDFDPVPGKIAVKFLKGGTWSVCETQPPFNHWNANPACKQISVAYGVPTDVGYFINYEKQVYYPGPNGVR